MLQDLFETNKQLIIKEKRNSTDESIFLYPKRFLILTVFCLINWINCVIFITFGPIANNLTTYFDKSGFYIDLFSIVFTLPPIFLIVLGPYLLRNKGIRWSMIFCGLVNFLGAGIRFVGSYSPVSVYYWFILVGQFICAVIQPVTLSAPPFVAAKWFGIKERSIGK